MVLTEDEEKIKQKAINYARANKKKIARRIACTETYVGESNPVSVFMAGSPGAGKTETSRALIDEFGGNILRIDADELRHEFEGYSGANSYLFQFAASILVDKIHDLALKQQQSFLLDATLSDLKRAKHNIDRSLKHGRDVQIIYVYQDPVLAWSFVQAREKVEGRRVLPALFINQYFAARDVVNELKKHYGSNIRVELLLKNNDNSVRIYEANIDVIDYHIPENYTPASLDSLLFLS